MHANEYLFPQRQTRRHFLKTATVAAASVALPALSKEKDAKTPVRIGSGAHTYEAVEGWGQLPAGMNYGLGCGIVVDSKDRVYITSRSTNPVSYTHLTLP